MEIIKLGFFEKARMQNKGNYLQVVLLNKQETGVSAEIKNGLLFVYDNKGNLVKVASSFTISFIDIE